MLRITFIGAAFLAVIAIVPSVIQVTMGVDPNVASFYGGTGLLIVISVALVLVSKINSHLVMRNYPGLTEDCVQPRLPISIAAGLPSFLPLAPRRAVFKHIFQRSPERA